MLVKYIKKFVFNLAIRKPLRAIYRKYQIGAFEKVRRRVFPTYEKEFKFLPELVNWKCSSLNHPNVINSHSEDVFILDIGANVGQSAYALSRLFPFSKIMCFEPNPVILKQLEINSLERWVTVGLGLSGKTSEVTLSIPSYNGIYFTGLTSIDEKSASKFLNSKTIWNFKEKKFNLEPHQVKTKDLDSFDLNPHIIKIDTEGMEISILNGALSTISRVHPILMVECSGTLNSVREILDPLGYEPYEYSPNYRWIKSLGKNLNQVFLYKGDIS